MTRTALETWFERYGESHQHPWNRALHTLCVPVITIVLVALLALVPVPGLRFSLGELLLGAALLLCAMLSWRHAIGLAVCSFAIASVWPALAPYLTAPRLWGLFAIAWAGQFIGHAIEGKRPSFGEDLRFLLIGPLWVLQGLYRRLGL